MVSPELLNEFYANSLVALPVVFDLKTRAVEKHPEHDPGKVTLNLQYALTLNEGYMNGANGIAIKVLPPLGMLDFDLKNTDDKEVYDKWFKQVVHQDDTIPGRLCIERTRNGGYHVYFKYARLDRKIPLARDINGREKISLYTGGLLSYCSPSPGYEVIHNSFEDIDFVTEEQYDIMITAAAAFHEEEERPDQRPAPVDYPPEYESICLQFDRQIDDKAFNQILNDITLYECNGWKPKKRQHYVPYLRRGSQAAYSAKVYFKSKRLLLFTDSLKKFPNWNDYNPNDPKGKWSLTPAKILFYKNDQDWSRTLEEVNAIAESLGIQFEVTQPYVTLPEDRLKFPYDIFPQPVQDFIDVNIIQHEYLAGSILAATSAALGNSVTVNALDGFSTKPILYMAIVAPPGGFKSPALKVSFAPLERADALAYKSYRERKEEYRKEYARWQKSKGERDQPAEPQMQQVLIKDSTIEMVVKILSHNPDGCCIVADELSGFINRMNQYRQGDEVQKWLELWNGGTVLLQRITREESKVDNSFCSIIGGIQPGVLESISTGDNKVNGFYHRFLFIYPQPNPKPDWQSLTIPEAVKVGFHNYFNQLINARQQKIVYTLSYEAQLIHEPWYNAKNDFYNRSNDDNVKGIITKYQEYCFRFAGLIQAMHDGENRGREVAGVNMERAVRLTEYFLGNMAKALKFLNPETPLDKMSDYWKMIYATLPHNFTLKGVEPFLKDRRVNVNSFRSWVSRNSTGQDSIFTQLERGTYEKMYK